MAVNAPLAACDKLDSIFCASASVITHILIPTDGSDLSARAARFGIAETQKVLTHSSLPVLVCR